MRSSPVYSLIALIFLAITSGCGGDDENPIVPQPPSRTSIEALLTEFFEVAYQSKNGALYAEMLSADFEFEFLLADAESLQNRGILSAGSNSWDRDADLAGTNNMFGSANVGGIALNISIDQPEPDTVACAGCQRVLATVSLRVTTRPNDIDPIIFVIDSKQEFVVGKDPADTTQWVIVRQYDSDLPAKAGGPGLELASPTKRAGSKPLATERTAWGQIKGLFAVLPPG